MSHSTFQISTTRRTSPVRNIQIHKFYTDDSGDVSVVFDAHLEIEIAFTVDKNIFYSTEVPNENVSEFSERAVLVEQERSLTIKAVATGKTKGSKVDISEIAIERDGVTEREDSDEDHLLDKES